MGFNEFMTKLFGNKSQRDLKEITPYVDKIKAVYPSIQKLSNDELRAKTDEIKQRIQDYVAAERAQVEELRKGIDDKELEERESIWAEVDKIEKAITDKMEEVLEESLPEVFSIMKETARRFTENEEVVVTATDFDRDLATKYDFVRIEDDKAIFLNHWKAGGNEITWDMVHYDVQLFGGVVLHKGKIAEMGSVQEIFRAPKTQIGQELVFHEGSNREAYAGRLPYCYRVVFKGGISNEPVLGRMMIDCNGVANILAGNTRNIDGEVFGQMILQFPEDEALRKKMIQYLLDQGVEVEEVAYV